MAAAGQIPPADLKAIMQGYEEINTAEVAVTTDSALLRNLSAQLAELTRKMATQKAKLDAGQANLKSKASEFEQLVQQRELFPYFQKTLGKEELSSFEIAQACHRELSEREPGQVKANHDLVLESLDEEVDALAGYIRCKIHENEAYLMDWGLQSQQNQEEQIAKIAQQLRSSILIDRAAVVRYVNEFKRYKFPADHYIKFAKLCGYALVLGGPEGDDIVSLNPTVRMAQVEKADHAEILKQFSNERISEIASLISTFWRKNNENKEERIPKIVDWLRSNRLPDPDHIKEILNAWNKRNKEDIAALCGYELEFGGQYGETVLSVKPRLPKET